jgi:hypothetical protein
MTTPRPVPRFVNSCTWCWLILDGFGLKAVGDACEILVYVEERQKCQQWVTIPLDSRGTRLSVFWPNIATLECCCCTFYMSFHRSVTMTAERIAWEWVVDIERSVMSDWSIWDKGQAQRRQEAADAAIVPGLPSPPHRYRRNRRCQHCR